MERIGDILKNMTRASLKHKISYGNSLLKIDIYWEKYQNDLINKLSYGTMRKYMVVGLITLDILLYD